ncbi:hypothetical protein [Arthrobacter crystallopoietes]|uniref:hypothetical protein n=1 Tax=Crystallibacter crystallopoietes TaxID=37928 RepID=UPI001ABE10E9|nr:hypothetical protein [Arthrobacter crystallopoietes]QTG79437.1 hypothetical protein J5251_10765 [Arthrobacter crystallopoietes]
MKNPSARGRRRAGPTISSHGVTSLVRGRRRAKDEAPSAVSFRGVGALASLAVVATVAAAAALPLDQVGSQEASAGRPQLQTSVKAWPISAPSNEAEPTFSRPTTDSTAAAQKDTQVAPSAATQPTLEGDAIEQPVPRTTESAGEAAAPLTGVVGEATGAAKDKVADATDAATDAADKATAAATDAADKATAAATDAAKPTASPTADAAVPTSPATTPPAKQSARAVPEDPEPTRSGARSRSAAPVEPAPTSEAADPEEEPTPEASPTAERKKHRQHSDRTVDDAEWLWILLGEDGSR